MILTPTTDLPPLSSLQAPTRSLCHPRCKNLRTAWLSHPIWRISGPVAPRSWDP
ncbi:hypothetical protein B0H10DRAFT_2066755, partial [Mycena sp. CBHHK59/15]